MPLLSAQCKQPPLTLLCGLRGRDAPRRPLRLRLVAAHDAEVDAALGVGDGRGEVGVSAKATTVGVVVAA